MKKFGLPIIILLLLIVVPVLVTQVAAKEERNYQAVSLEETSYEEISFRNEAQDIDLGNLSANTARQSPLLWASRRHSSLA